MKQLKDLKNELLNNKFNNFYVFCGDDFGLRKHYINYIAKRYNRITVLDSYESISENKSGSSLFPTYTLYIIYDCSDFCNLTVEQINGFLRKIEKDCVIFDFESTYDKSVLFKEFSDSITYFPLVSDTIGMEFVQSEVNLLYTNRKNVAYNCYNNYGEILMETNKIKSYAREKNITDEAAYEILISSNQLNIRYDVYDNDLLVNDLLVMNNSRLPYWHSILKLNNNQDFWFNLHKTVTDFLIAYFIKKYNKYDGGSKAYNLGLSWYRIKVIRELGIVYDAESLLYFVDVLCDLDYFVKTGKMKAEDIFDYFVYTIL